MMSQATETNRVFHLRKGCRNTGLLGLPFFLGMMAMSIYLGLSDGKILAATILGCFWAFWVVLSLSILLAYYRKALRIEGATLAYKGVFRTETMTLSQLVQLRWKRRGVAVLKSRLEKIRIELGDFDPENQRELIRWLRLSVPTSLQQGWDRFCYHFALRLCGHVNVRPFTREELAVARRRCDRFFIPFNVLVACIGGWFAWYLGMIRWLFIPVPFVAMWLVVRVMRPRKECVSELRSRQQQVHNRFAKQFACRSLIWMALVIVGVVLGSMFCALPFVPLWQWCGTLLLFSIVLWEAYRTEQRQWSAEQENVEWAVREWERCESVGQGGPTHDSGNT